MRYFNPRVLLLLAAAVPCLSALDEASLEALVMQQAELISRQQGELEALKAQVNSLQSRLDTKVAFHVRLSERRDRPFTGNQTLVFDSVDLNEGGDYDNTTGIFTATVSGLYQFSLHITHSPPGRLHVGIVKNGLGIAEAEASGDDEYLDRSSTTVLVELAVGDQVWVKRVGGTSTRVQGGFRTAFGGVLLAADQPE